jgi:hypothetical protein
MSAEPWYKGLSDIQADAFTRDRGPKTNKEGITPQEDSYHAEKYQP